MATKTKIKKTLDRVDMMGTSLEVGDFVASARGNGLVIGVVTKIHDTMVRVNNVMTKSDSLGWLEYPEGVIKLNTEDVLAYKLKKL